MKNPLIPAGIEPVTFRIVAQHLNHYATAVSRVVISRNKNCILPGLLAESQHAKLTALSFLNIPSVGDAY